MTTFIPTTITACASKAGKTYWKIMTSQGEATCFDYPIVQELERNLNKAVSLYDLETNDKGFINIRPTRGNKQQAQVQSQPVIAQAQDNFKEARMSKDVSIYTSYAKDIFLALLTKTDVAKIEISTEEIMKKAVALIKQAKTSFERTEVSDFIPKVVKTMQG